TAVIIPGDALFAFDKDEILSEQEARRRSKENGVQVDPNEPPLKKAGEIIQSHPDSTVVIMGHTDGIGGIDYNLDLSRRRAVNVSRWLTSHGYVDAGKVRPFGLGKGQPVASNRSAAGRRKNRRVEIKIYA